MSPPPSTPTPRRFLLAKRGHGTQLSQTSTPRFHSTPRFGSSSVPRPTQRRKEQGVEDIEEVEDVVEESSLEDDDKDEGESGSEDDGHDQEEGVRRALALKDSIDIESDDEASLQEADEASSGVERDVRVGGAVADRSPKPSDDDDSIEEREAKRRRVSISPMSENSPNEDGDDGDLDMSAGEHSITSDSDIGHSPLGRADHDELSFEDRGHPKALQQPTFRPAPRFKPAELDPTAEGLPAAFSPQRRGARYIPGGLAAEVQGWLSEVKGWGGDVDRPADSAMRLTVDDIRPGRRMYLVRCRLDSRSGLRRFVLAGEGRLTGLGRRADVGVGSVVVVGEPVWDVELDGELWTVACDWSVAS